MIPFPSIDPVIVRIGPLAVRWYGLMYLLGFVAGYYVVGSLARRRGLPLDRDTLADLIFQAIIGVILGGRLGYVLFYNPSFYLEHPLQVFAVWEGGMSFHGGLLGVVVAAALFCLRRKLPVLLTGDILVTGATIGLGLGRIGNFINGELYGRVTDVPWGIVFPGGGPQARHPSQLYEAFLEGAVLLGVLWWLNRRQVAAGVPFFSFFLLYGTFRFTVEFFREPDAHLGFLWGGATMGQLLSIPMMILGATGVFWAVRRGRAG